MLAVKVKQYQDGNGHLLDPGQQVHVSDAQLQAAVEEARLQMEQRIKEGPEARLQMAHRLQAQVAADKLQKSLAQESQVNQASAEEPEVRTIFDKVTEPS